MQISRLFRLLYLLLERERIPASELAQTLEVSVRTIYRDVQTLGEAGIPVYAERGRDGGIAILPTFRLNKSMLSAGEKQDMLSALQALASTGTATSSENSVIVPPRWPQSEARPPCRRPKCGGSENRR